MSNYILPIGSVVKTSNIKALVVGYFFDREKGTPELKYLLAPYPLGLAEDALLTKCGLYDVQLIEEGYKSDISESFINYVSFLNDYLRNHSEKELFELITEVEAEPYEENEEEVKP